MRALRSPLSLSLLSLFALSQPGCFLLSGAALNFCGDGLQDPDRDEQCDNGSNNSDEQADACRTDCTLASCGDGVLDSNEACDDGNNTDADGCEADCSLPACQNGIVDPGEFCPPAAPVILPLADATTGELVLADLDNDGDQDLAAVVTGGQQIALFSNEGGELLAAAPIENVGVGASALLAADLNGDGLLDLVSSAALSDDLRIFTNQGGLSFIEETVLEDIPQGPVSLALVDFDGDGLLDIAGASLQDEQAFVLRNDPATPFAEILLFDIAGEPRGIVAGDLDSDGDQDLAVARSAEGQDLLTLVQNDGQGLFTLLDIPTGEGPFDVAVGDLEDDGDLDLATANLRDGEVGVSLFQSDGAGFLIQDGPFLPSSALLIADLNFDQRPDLAATAAGEAFAGVLLDPLNANDLFLLDAGLTAGALAAGDIDGDGAIDLVFLSGAGNGNQGALSLLRMQP